MLILTLVASAAAAMVWTQQRAVELQAAERARAQAGWILAGAQDWARLILRSDAGRAFPPAAGWARKLEESRLTQFLGGEGAGDAKDALDVFLSGEIDDAQSRYNLRRLFADDGQPVPAEIAALRRLCAAAGADEALAERLVGGLAAAWFARAEGAPLAPQRVEQLAWLGVDASSLQAIAPYLTILPTRTPVNANTAAAPALLAAIDGLELADAQRLVQTLQREPAHSSAALRALLPAGAGIDEARVGVHSSHFEVRARLRWDERLLEERWLLERRGVGAAARVQVLRSERRSLPAAAG